MRYAAEDVQVDADPGSYLPLVKGGRRHLVTFRIVAGIASDSDTLVIPLATRPGFLDLAVGQLDGGSKGPFEEGSLFEVLLVREPDENQWLVLDSVQVDVSSVVR